jgi:hypothetical protein
MNIYTSTESAISGVPLVFLKHHDRGLCVLLGCSSESYEEASELYTAASELTLAGAKYSMSKLEKPHGL